MSSNYKTQVADAFSKYHLNYAEQAHIQKQIAQTLSSMLPHLNAPKILEIGCGTGFLTKCLLEQYPDGVFDITDISEHMVLHCQKKYNHHNARFFVMDGENPQNIQPKYDLIVSSMAVQWFETPLESLQKLGKLGPVHYAALGKKSFQTWRKCLDELNLPQGIMDTPDWPNALKEENLLQTYSTPLTFLKALKNVGTGVPIPSYQPLSVADMRAAIRLFQSKEMTTTTNWHIVYGTLS